VLLRSDIGNLLRPLQLYYFHLWSVYCINVWRVTPGWVIEAHWRFGWTSSKNSANCFFRLIVLDLLHNPENGGTTFIRIVGKHLPLYTAWRVRGFIRFRRLLVYERYSFRDRKLRVTMTRVEPSENNTEACAGPVGGCAFDCCSWLPGYTSKPKLPKLYGLRRVCWKLVPSNKNVAYLRMLSVAQRIVCRMIDLFNE
jgi:hypothetical protein